MKLAALGIAAALSCALVSPAGAQPGNTPPAEPPPTTVPPPAAYNPGVPAGFYGQPMTHTERYGTRIAMVDGICMAVIVVGAIVFVSGLVEDSNNDEGSVATGAVMMIGGSIGLMVGGPIVHYQKGNGSAVWKSLALRVGLPLIGSAIGEAMRSEDCSGDVCNETNSGVGSSLGGIGLLTAMAIDWFVLAKHSVTTYGPSPYVATGRDGGLSFGLTTRF